MHVYFAGTNTEIQGFNRIHTDFCSTYGLQLELDDVNFNPLPVDTKVESANVDIVTVQEILPKTVPNRPPVDVNGNSVNTFGTTAINPANLATRQGSVHTIPVKPSTKCSEGGAGLETGSFTIKITSPQGVSVAYNFALEYPIAVTVTCTPPQVLQNGICVTPTSPSITVSLDKTTITANPPSGPITASATVRDASGALVPNKLVRTCLSTSTPPIAALHPPTGPALRNSCGVATIQITRSGTTAGAGTITASAQVGTVTVPGTAGFAAN
jgi:hypothetical protein